MFERDARGPKPDDASGTSAFLGKGSRVTGKLAFEGPVRIEGHVEGEIAAQDTLDHRRERGGERADRRLRGGRPRPGDGRRDRAQAPRDPRAREGVREHQRRPASSSTRASSSRVSARWAAARRQRSDKDRKVAFFSKGGAPRASRRRSRRTPRSPNSRHARTPSGFSRGPVAIGDGANASCSRFRLTIRSWFRSSCSWCCGSSSSGCGSIPPCA